MEYLPIRLAKMRVSAIGGGAHYALETVDAEIVINDLVGRRLSLQFDGRIECVACGRSTPRSYSQGYCYPCAQRLPECDLCIVSPDRCHYDAGTCRDPEWARTHCHQEHVVYLANTAGLKVGITRATQLPVRWLDQGAAQALPILRTATRQQAGFVEAALRSHVADRTDWRRLLRGVAEPVELVAERERLLAMIGDQLEALRARFGAAQLLPVREAQVWRCDYPVSDYPCKINALGLDKQPRLEGTLLGIKGQYLVLDTGVFNVRKHSGYRVRLGW